MQSLVAPRTRVVYALPIHSHAGLRGGEARLGFLGPLLEIGGSIIGGLFAKDTKKAELKAQKGMLEAQLRSADFQAQLQANLASQQVDLGARQVNAAVETARIQARNELAALETQYAAELSAQRVKKQVAQETLSAQLLAETQSGIFGLAQTGMNQATSLAQYYPSKASTTIIMLVLGTAAAVAFMRRPSSSRNKKRRKIKAGKAEYESSNFAEAGSYGSPSFGSSAA